MKNKKLIILIVSLVILILGVTYAGYQWVSSNNTNIATITNGIYVIFNGGADITGANLVPTLTKEEGIEKEMTVKMLTQDKTSTMNLYLNINSIGSGLTLTTEFKWALYKENTLVNSGDFYGKQATDTITLASNQTVTTTLDTYYLYIWIDGTIDNSTDIMNQSFNFTLYAEGTGAIRVDSEDDVPSTPETPTVTPPNSPDLITGLIPVTYVNNAWVKADSTNESDTYKWYDYDEKMWANAVLVSSTNRSTYQSASAGTSITASDILAYYVWIPRYKYKVWNINKVVGTDSYNARTTGIDIEFESEKTSTGTVTCTDYSYATVSSTTKSQTCTGEEDGNDEYYTHPAFTFGSDELRGIWVGKFELSSSSPTTSRGGGNSTSYTARILPDVYTWTYNTVSNFYLVIKNMQTSSNVYGLSTDTTDIDTHMIKNLEWGAIAYFANSKYGLCDEEGCTNIGINAYYNTSSSGSGGSRKYYYHKAGCGPTSSGSTTTSSSTCNLYNTAVGMEASTTQNVYGIFDLSGGAYEVVMGNESSASGSYTYYARSAGSNFSYSSTTAKYLDQYAYDSSNYNNQTAYNRARLGDATGEVVLTASSTGGWYSDYSYFPYYQYPWFLRGGNANQSTSAGLFYFYRSNGNYSSDPNQYTSTRAILVDL